MEPPILCQQKEITPTKNSESDLNPIGKKIETAIENTIKDINLLNEFGQLSITKKSSGIYLILNLKNLKWYVGSTNNFLNRWRNHRNGLKKFSHENDKLQKSWCRHGADSFAFIVAEYVELERLKEVEQMYLDYAKSLTEKTYNLNFGASRPIWSDDSKIKLSNSLKKFFSNKDEIKKLKTIRKNQWTDELKNEQRVRASATWYNGKLGGKGKSHPSYDKTVYRF
jgi:group I intron endonuclease